MYVIKTLRTFNRFSIFLKRISRIYDKNCLSIHPWRLGEHKIFHVLIINISFRNTFNVAVHGKRMSTTTDVALMAFA